MSDDQDDCMERIEPILDDLYEALFHGMAVYQNPSTTARLWSRSSAHALPRVASLTTPSTLFERGSKARRGATSSTIEDLKS